MRRLILVLEVAVVLASGCGGDDDTGDEIRRSLWFDIGKAHEQAGEYDRAFEAYTNGKRMRVRPWDPAAAAARHERIDCLVNNAGTNRVGPMVEQSAENLAAHLDLPASSVHTAWRPAGRPTLRRGAAPSRFRGGLPPRRRECVE